jgi:hypothetical protein
VLGVGWSFVRHHIRAEESIGPKANGPRKFFEFPENISPRKKKKRLL